MYEVIQTWLRSSKDFDAGLEILRRYSDNTFLISMLSMGKDYWNEKELYNELKDLASSIQTVEKEEKFVKAKEVIKENLKCPTDSINAPIEVKDAIERRKRLYDEGKKLHARLELYKDDKERYKAAKRIIEIRAELKKIWSFTNFYRDNLRLPEVIEKQEQAKLEQLDDYSLNKMWNTYYKYIHRFKEDQTKTETLKERITIAHAIKELLIERNAFQYPNLNIPPIHGN